MTRFLMLLALLMLTCASALAATQPRFELPYDLAVARGGTIYFPDRARILTLAAILGAGSRAQEGRRRTRAHWACPGAGRDAVRGGSAERTDPAHPTRRAGSHRCDRSPCPWISWSIRRARRSGWRRSQRGSGSCGSTSPPAASSRSPPFGSRTGWRRRSAATSSSTTATWSAGWMARRES